MVVSLGDGAVGVVVDATREILRVDPDMIDPAPALLTRGEGEAEIASICRLEEGRRLVALLSPDRLFRSELVRRILAEQGESRRNRIATGSKRHGRRAVHHFSPGRSGLRHPDCRGQRDRAPPDHITRLPKAPAFIDGVMNLRGSVVPIVDLRRRFDLSTAEHAGSQRILMVAIGGVIAGFLVDSVSEIMKVQIDAIQPGARIVVGPDAADLPGHQSGRPGDE